MNERYSVEEVAGTLFLRFGNLVLAANIGEADMIADSTRDHFARIVETMNASLDSGPPSGDSTG
jgi:hypothetical protein